MLSVLDMSSSLAEPDESLSHGSYRRVQPDDEPLSILLVEDTTSDALLLRLALDAARLSYVLHTVQGGDEVLPWLAQALMKKTLPDVIMLDLGLPRIDGFEVLEYLAECDPAIRSIPVIILTGYEHFDYIGENYNLYVPAYITKPCEPEKIRKALTGIGRERRLL